MRIIYSFEEIIEKIFKIFLFILENEEINSLIDRIKK